MSNLYLPIFVYNCETCAQLLFQLLSKIKLKLLDLVSLFLLAPQKEMM